MTLFKQIAIVFSIFIILTMGSVIYLNFKSANEFIQNQLYSVSEDTATSLGLSLSINIPKDGEDLSTMETMINAIFDRGYYEYIKLKDMDGKVLINNQNRLKIKSVPDWFVKIINLKVPTAKTQISSGWIPYGILSVKLHSGYAYLQIWNTFLDMSKTFLILVFVVLLGLYFLLKTILKPLKGVEKQAIAITKNDFIIQEKLPFTTEFKNVVIGMNKMVKKVKEIFEHEATIVQKYNKLLYNDSDTGMGNRKFFSLRLSSFLNHQDEKSSGTVVLFVLNNFEKTKQKLGYKELSQYINKLAEVFYKVTQNVEERVVTRLKDSDFAIILPNTNYEKTKQIVEEFFELSNKIKSEKLKNIKEFYISAGATYYDDEDTQKEILARADFALSSAKMKQEEYIHFHEVINNESLMELGQEEWHRLITNALKRDGIKLALQAVKNQNKEIFHQEAYLRISNDDGKFYPARVFMPMINSLNLSDEVDKKVISRAFELSKNNPIAINIAPSFINNTKNIFWLENLMRMPSNKYAQISFEASNYAVLNNLENFISFSKLVRELNFTFGIDNFDIQTSSLEYLQDLNPAYIKADKSFFIDMNSKNESSYQSFYILTKSLEINLIATAIENVKEEEKLKEIDIKLMQGAYIDEPSIQK